MNTLFIVVPAYNESENIRNLIDGWYPVIEKHHGDGQSRLVVIDDGSKDDTYAILQEYEKTHPLLTARTKPNGGHGATLLYGYGYAIDQGADYIFQTDSDGQTLPEEFDRFWKLRRKYDAVIGNRTNRQDGNDRKFVEHVLLFILRMIFRVKLPDSNAPYRLMKADLVAKYLDYMPTDFNLPNVMLTTFFAYYHESLRFVPITFQPRQGGTNSINVKKIIKIGWKALGDFHKIYAGMKKRERV